MSQIERYLENRLVNIDTEIQTEPATSQNLYRVVPTRELVGMVYLGLQVRG